MEAILSDEVNIDGFVGPSHVSIIIGSDAYDDVAIRYQKPVVIAGFEPLDVLQSILMLIKMINKAESGVLKTNIPVQLAQQVTHMHKLL